MKNIHKRVFFMSMIDNIIPVSIALEFAIDFFKDIEKKGVLKISNLYISVIFREKFVATPLNGKVSDRILSLEKPCFCFCC